MKEVWHKADLEPEAQTRYIEMKELARKSLKFHWRSLKHPVFPFTLSLVKWLDAAPGDDTKDINKAIAKLSPFFYPEFFESEEGARFRDSLLFKQEERANHIPDIRSDISNARRLKEFWKEWDGEKKMMKSLDDTPAEWDIAIRPIIARCKLILEYPVDNTSEVTNQSQTQYTKPASSAIAQPNTTPAKR